MIRNDTATSAAQLEADIRRSIPMTRAMGLAVSRYTGSELEMAAPLAPNINDKGCAFGGSIAMLLTVTGWGFVELGLRTATLDCDLFVGESRLRYHAPVWGNLRSIARPAGGDTLEKLVAALRERGRGHADVVCEIAGADRPAATLNARYFARLRA